MLHMLAQGIASALPGRCEVCRAWPALPLCEGCVVRFAQPRPRCRRCALPVAEGILECGQCLREPPALDACHAAVSYDFPWSTLIARFKFQGQPGLAGTLAALMRSAPWVESALEDADLVLPMPLSNARIAERGYNQAHELARRLAPGKTDATLLRRLLEAPPQVGQDRQSRQAGVLHAFALDPLRASRVTGRKLLLVDDVMTTGASLFSAAAVLRRSGARKVNAVVLARTD